VFKRTFDIIVSFLALAVLWPLLIIIGLLVAWDIGRPVLYVVRRPGYKASPFKIFKFRTMTLQRAKDGGFLPDSQRLTNIGRFLRATSLDELPTLVNVILGDMSLVGPRPLLMEYLPLYSEEQARRHDVRPGITGWAQVNGRNSLTWEDRFALDVWYVENQSFWLDLKILFLTLLKVLRREGINAPDHVTMPRFTGSDRS
jgi:lipopolysaccharide/colanic/teichoic acid biosynthesis glycosyltransferase